jgi:2-keto-4-pentenoate hydratase/2-oxohepta-3-ene-1,7-dioic acid hydratase in catechol pathway
MTKILFRNSRQELPVGKIVCLGRNYAAHAKEMNADVPRTPVLFLKPSTAVVPDGGSVVLPPISRDMHHEVEMVVVIGERGKDIRRAEAFAHVAGYAVGLDMTLRDVQAEAKKAGLPWSVAKGFDTSAPVSLVTERDLVPDPHNLELSLKVNGKLRQHATTKQMLFRVDEIIEYVSSIFTLERGDLIFTGTPEGVGPVVPGDLLEAELESVGTLRVGVRTASRS